MLTVDFKEIARRENLEQFLEFFLRWSNWSADTLAADGLTALQIT